MPSARWRTVGPTRYRWNPCGRPRVHGRRRRKNPIRDHFKGGTPFARVIVGFNVGSRSKWTIDDLERVWIDVRKRQGEPPDATFMAQRGIYSHQTGPKTIVRENGGSIVVLNTFGEDEGVFLNRLTEAAEVIAKKLRQETVIVEYGKGGQVTDTMFVSAA